MSAGGLWRAVRVRELLEALNDTSHHERNFICEWLGEGFDPQEFSVAEVNRRLRNQRSPRRKAAAKD